VSRENVFLKRTLGKAPPTVQCPPCRDEGRMVEPTWRARRAEAGQEPPTHLGADSQPDCVMECTFFPEFPFFPAAPQTRAPSTPPHLSKRLVTEKSRPQTLRGKRVPRGAALGKIFEDHFRSDFMLLIPDWGAVLDKRKKSHPLRTALLGQGSLRQGR
jgi:hypothetical protein